MGRCIHLLGTITLLTLVPWVQAVETSCQTGSIRNPQGKEVFEVIAVAGRLGKGGFAEVCRAIVRLPDGTERDVALKVYRHKSLRRFAQRIGSQELNPFSQAHERVNALLLDHPLSRLRPEWGNLRMRTPSGNPVHVVVAELEKGTVLDLAQSFRLTHDQSKLPIHVERLEQLMLDASDALSTLHSRDLVHTDIKPSNLMLRHTSTDSGTFLLSDLDHVMGTGSKVFAYTPDYLPPEATGLAPYTIRRANPAGDIFALSASLYEVARGQRPIRAYETSAEGAWIRNQVAITVAELNPTYKTLLDRLTDEAIRAKRPALEGLERMLANPLHAAFQREVESAFRETVYGNTQLYKQFLDYIESDLAQVSALLPDSETQAKFQEVRSYIRWGLSHDPAARINAQRQARVHLQWVLKESTLCVERFGNLPRMSLGRALLPTQPRYY